MHALDVEEELPLNERPTIPVPAPCESEIRLKVAQVPLSAATVDVVVCDLSRDPRSEDYDPQAAWVRTVSVLRRRARRRRRSFAR